MSVVAPLDYDLAILGAVKLVSDFSIDQTQAIFNCFSGRMEMQALVLALCLTLTAAPAFAQTITPLEAKDHVGQNVTVEGPVSEVDHAASGKMIFIDMGGHYPNNVFAGVIFTDDASKFPGVDSLDGKVVDITGTIKFYQGRTEIILNDPAQIKAK